MQTIGERLEEARKRKGITIREAAEATKIRGDYLQKFESNQFDINLSDIYVRGFLRTYSSFLKLPAERVVADYNALGSHSAENSKARQVSREVYGRMDLSISSSGGTKSKPGAEASAEGEAAEGAPSKASPSGRKFATIGTSLPQGPFIDQRLVRRIAIGAAAVVLALLVIWGIRSLASGSSKAEKQAAATAPAEPSITFYALDTVRIKVALKRGADDNVGEQLFQGTLMRGESRTLPKKGPLFLTADALQNVQFDTGNGKRVSPSDYGYKGYDRIEIR